MIKTQIAGPNPKDPQRSSRSGADSRICVSDKFPVMLIPLIQEPHSENQCSRRYLKTVLFCF